MSKVELGHRQVTVGEAVAFAEALGFPLADLVSDEPLRMTVTLT